METSRAGRGGRGAARPSAAAVACADRIFVELNLKKDLENVERSKNVIPVVPSYGGGARGLRWASSHGAADRAAWRVT